MPKICVKRLITLQQSFDNDPEDSAFKTINLIGQGIREDKDEMMNKYPDVGRLRINTSINSTRISIARASGDEDTDGYYITINSLRPSRIVKRSDDKDTDMRWLDIIPQSTLQGRGILQGQEEKLLAWDN